MSNLKQTPVAIVSMGAILPGADQIDTFWRNILNKTNTIRTVSENRWICRPEYMTGSGYLPDKTISKNCSLVDDFNFDPTAFSLDPDLLGRLDPLFQMVLQAGADATRHLAALNKDRTGVILAAIALPTDSSSRISRKTFTPLFEKVILGRKKINAIDAVESLSSRVTGLPAAILANALGCRGGSYTLDAACASSLYAVKLSCDELLSGRADAMIAGGVSRPDCLYTQVGFSQLRALSPSGNCAPFDQTADGLVVGEGAGLLVLKRYEDALRDKDKVYGLIKGIGLSNDMKGNILAPDSEGQVRAMHGAYESAGLMPQDMDLIECHGAGTPMGDMTEMQSLVRLWGRDNWSEGQCAIGSIKSMIGHLLTAAGAAGMIKALLALNHKILPPSMGFKNPPESSPLRGSPFRVQVESEDWQKRDPAIPRRAAVSAFGFGGINAHLILEEPVGESGTMTVKQDPDAPHASHAQYALDAPHASEAPHALHAQYALDRSVRGTHGKNSSKSDDPAPIAIIGMDTAFGNIRSLDRFKEIIFNGRSIIGSTPDSRWKGCERFIQSNLDVPELPGGYMADMDIHIKDFHIPPKELPDIIPQHLLMLKTASRAMRDANLPTRSERPGMGVIIGMNFDYEATNFHLRWYLDRFMDQRKENLRVDWQPDTIQAELSALKDMLSPPLTPNRTLGALGGIIASRIAREFCFGGPSFTVSAEDASGLRALQIGVNSLRKYETDAYLVGAVDLAGDVRNIATAGKIRRFSKTGRISPFDRSADGTLPGEGAAALVLMRLDQAVENGHRIYAVIRGTGHAGEMSKTTNTPTEKACVSALTMGFEDARMQPTGIGYVEAHGSGDPDEDNIETTALHLFFKSGDEPDPAHRIPIGSVKPNIGHSGAAAGMASVIKASLCVYHEMIPPHINYASPANPEWLGNRFHIPVNAQYWARNKDTEPRSACISSMTPDGNASAVIIEEFPFRKPGHIPSQVELERKRPMGPAVHGLYGVEGETKQDLLEGLNNLDSHVKQAGSTPIETLAQTWYQAHPFSSENKRRISIISQNSGELRRSLQEAIHAVKNDRPMKFTGRGGVRYSPVSDIASGKMAFVYPGSGNHYLGMGRDISLSWPGIYRELDLESPGLKDQLLPHIYSPHRVSWTPGWEKDAHLSLVSDPLNMIFGQVIHGAVMSRLIMKFSLIPSAVIGYSLGETTGMFAHGAWPNRHEMLERMRNTDLFTAQLSGPCLSARKAWNIKKDEPFQWAVAVVNRSAETINKVIKKYDRVRLLIVNTPRECVIGGDSALIKAMVENLDCDAYYLNGVVTVHCDAAEPVAKAYKDLHFFPTCQPENLSFYSCAGEAAHHLSDDRAAQSILSQALSGFHFPNLIEKAYQDGIRIFLELGPSSSCTRMIRQILGRKPHLAVSAGNRGEDEFLTILKCLGTLMAENIPLNLDFLYGTDAFPPADTKNHTRDNQGRMRMIIGGGPLIPKTSSPVSHSDTGNRPSREFQQKGPTFPFKDMIRQIDENIEITTRVHQRFLDMSSELTQSFERGFQLQSRLLLRRMKGLKHLQTSAHSKQTQTPSPLFSRSQCLEFAVGSIEKVLGPDFSEIDTYKVRVRLPDEPLMLVDRIMTIEGDKLSLSSGRIVTEHDVKDNAWYLDGGHAPVCISVEAGQADLFLCSYLGIDHKVKGERSYRLLDATVKFHRELPVPGDIIRYEIEIEKFVRQGDTYLFFFRFNGYIGNSHLITMTNGCAGFFTKEEVRNSGGIIESETGSQPGAGKIDPEWHPLVPFSKETYSERALGLLRKGRLSECFGQAFRDIALAESLWLPGGRMELIHRIIDIDPEGGRYKLGMVRAEADIHRDDWFLTCHFMDDMVMPGTLMYECCAHTLRIFMQRLGWVTEKEGVYYEPVRNVESILKCRGPVTPDTGQVVYAVEVKEIGYDPEPYVIADAHMYADGHHIVRFYDMSMKMTGVTRNEIETFWFNRGQRVPGTTEILYDKESILEFATGRPSKAFGPAYLPFDQDRFIARLPAPPYSFLDRVVQIEPEPWVLKPDGWIETEYDVSPGDWYFRAERTGSMPYCVLNEIALQACGWLAAYKGSALRSEKDLRFRNLGGKAVQYRNILKESGCLTTRTRLTRVSEAGDMIIQDYEFQVLIRDISVYEGETHFGFFTSQALDQQSGIRNAEKSAYSPPASKARQQAARDLKELRPLNPSDPHTDDADVFCLPAGALSMVDRIEDYLPNGGTAGLGYIRGAKKIDPSEWFFKAHFYRDPVCPGSLGLESFIQLLKYMAIIKWPDRAHTHLFSPVLGTRHEWMYRGQILPSNHRIQIEADVTKTHTSPHPVIYANGYLKVDGLYIYKMDNFGISLIPR